MRVVLIAVMMVKTMVLTMRVVMTAQTLQVRMMEPQPVVAEEQLQGGELEVEGQAELEELGAERQAAVEAEGEGEQQE